MKPEEVIKISSQIRAMSDKGDIDGAYNIYRTVNHPEVFYVLGVEAYNLEKEDLARECFVEGAKFCTQGEHQYYNTIFSNSIGQCITLLFAKNLIRSLDNNILARLFLFGHLYLSNSINNYGTKAYESYNSRYQLMNETNYTNLFAGVLTKFGVLIEAIPLMNASDLHESSLGYINTPYFNNAKELNNKAYNIIQIYNSLNPQYRSTPEEFFAIGKMMNNEFYKKISLSTMIFSKEFMITDEI